MAIKTITGTPAIPPAITAGKIPYADGTNTLTYLPIGTATQILSVNATATAPQWINSTPRYGGHTLLASYSGSTNVVVSNIPNLYQEIRIIMQSSGQMSGSFIGSFTFSGGATTSNCNGAEVAWNNQATGAQSDGGNSGLGSTARLPSTATPNLTYDGGSYNLVDIRILDIGGTAIGGSSLAHKLMYSTAYTPPGNATTGYAFTINSVEYDVSSAAAYLTGFTVNLNAVSTHVLVYGV